MEDALLVREFQRSGDEALFQQLVERHRGPVFRLVLSILGAGHDGAAEELTQDVFVKVYRKLGQFRCEAKFSSWLYRIAYNQAVDYRGRAHFRLPHDSEEVLEMTPSTTAEQDPFTTAARARTATAVEECLAKLPDLYRSVLHLYYWMGMTVPEISETLSAPQGTVKSYLHRARARLHKLLATCRWSPSRVSIRPRHAAAAAERDAWFAEPRTGHSSPRYTRPSIRNPGMLRLGIAARALGTGACGDRGWRVGLRRWAGVPRETAFAASPAPSWRGSSQPG